MAVNGVSSSGQIGIQTFNFTGLSPEMMLAYMQSNLQSLDSQVAGILDDMNARRASMHVLNENLRELRSFQSRAADSDKGLRLSSPANEQLGAELRDLQHEKDDLISRSTVPGGEGTIYSSEDQARLDAIDQRITEIHHQPTVRSELKRMGFSEDEIDSIEKDGRVSDDDLKGLTEALDGELSELNDQTEYDSMRVQTLMNKRSQMIQLTSNVMRDLNDTAKSVIQNI